jgi:hypothetical protein
MEDCPRGYACMRGLEPGAVQEVSAILLARPVDRQVIEPEPPVAAPPEELNTASQVDQDAVGAAKCRLLELIRGRALPPSRVAGMTGACMTIH